MKEERWMIQMYPIELNNNLYTAIRVQLPETNLLMVSNDIGYIMCGALDVDLLNDLLTDREVIAARAVGVRSIEDLLAAPLQKVTHTATEKYGWEVGMSGEEALKKLTS